ncbi:hypothetical protein [Sorangium sp. So ce1078]|uniref:hypothetical protein n=1 Tax=Sorangium sp. So ce1078 TaxID=3133329 RepID=UPI003F63E6D6
MTLSSAGGQLVAGRRPPVARAITTGDSLMPTLAALPIDADAPSSTGGASADGRCSRVSATTSSRKARTLADMSCAD